MRVYCTMQYADQLHRAGLKSTAARVAVLRCLSQRPVAMSHPEICIHLESDGFFTDRTTVYRTLDALHKAGLLHKVPSADRVWLFSLSDVAAHGHTGDHHVHFRCDACTKTFCMEADDVEVNVSLPPAAARSFQVVSKELLLHGYCPDCPPS